MGSGVGNGRRYDYSRTDNEADSSINNEDRLANRKLSSFSFGTWRQSARRDSLPSANEKKRASAPNNEIRGVVVPILTIPSIYLPRLVLPRQLDAPLHQYNPIVDYKYNKVLGKGSFSVVQKATSVHGKVGDVPAEVAIKEIQFKNLTSAQLQNLQFEMNVLSQLHHPSVVALYHVYRTPQKIFLVMEYLKGGELLNMVSGRQKYTEEDAIDIIRQIIDAVSYIHACDVIHRDLKPENLIMQDHSRDSRIKIVDFGLCMTFEDAALTGKLDEGVSRASVSLCGTRGYVSPEVLHQCYYSSKCDMWAIGVICYILLSGRRPFSVHSFKQTLSGKYSVTDPEWKNVSDEAKEFIAMLLRVDPAERMSAKDALQHPWLTQIFDEIDEFDSFPRPGEKSAMEAAVGGGVRAAEESAEGVGLERTDTQGDMSTATARKAGDGTQRSTGRRSSRDLTGNLPHFAAFTVKTKFRRSLMMIMVAVRFKRAGVVFRTRSEADRANEGKSGTWSSPRDNGEDRTDPVTTLEETMSAREIARQGLFDVDHSDDE